MTDQNMFSGEEVENTEPQQQQQENSGDPTPSSENPFADKLQGIVNEKGEPKYRSVEDALEALQHSQQFIETLKREKKDLEEQYGMTQAELEKRASVEDVVQSLLNKQNPPKNEEGRTTPETSGLDESKVREMLDNMLNQRTQQETEAANLRNVVSSLTEKYGEQAKEVIRTRAKELNTTTTELESLAKRNPNMALSLLGGVDIKSSSPSKPTQQTPHNPPKHEEAPRKKGLINGGASSSELKDEWAAIRGDVYKKYGVEN